MKTAKEASVTAHTEGTRATSITKTIDGKTDRRVTKARDKVHEIAKGQPIQEQGQFPGGLTARQHAYVNGIVQGKSQIEAFLSAYNWNGNRDTASVSASRLAVEPKIAREISRRISEKDERTQHSASAIKRHVIDGFMELTKSPNENIRLRAFDRLGHIAGVDLYRDKPASQPLDELGSAELQARLLDRLREQLMIDVTPIVEGE